MRSSDELAAFFREGFEGVVPKRIEPETVKKSVIEQAAYSVDSHGSDSVDVAGIARFLLEAIGDIHEIQGGRFRVLKIARVPRNDAADVWRLSVLLTMGGKSKDAEPIAYEAHGEMECRFSEDDEILAGRIIESWTVDSESLHKSGGILMKEATADVRLDKLPIIDNWTVGKSQVRQYRFQTAVEDYNGDGFLDIAVATADDQALYWNGIRRRDNTRMWHRRGDFPRGDFSRKTGRTWRAGWISTTTATPI